MASRDRESMAPMIIPLGAGPAGVDHRGARDDGVAVNDTISIDETDQARLILRFPNDPSAMSRLRGRGRRQPLPPPERRLFSTGSSSLSSSRSRSRSRPRSKSRRRSRSFSSSDEDEVTGDEKELSGKLNDKDSAQLLAALQKQLSSVTEHASATPGFHSCLVDCLVEKVTKLEAECSSLKKQLRAAKNTIRQTQTEANPASPKTGNNQTLGDQDPDNVVETIHVVNCTMRRTSYYLDAPRMFKGDLKTDHLRGKIGIENDSRYMEARPHIIATYLSYHQCGCNGGADYHQIVGYKDGKLLKDSPVSDARYENLNASAPVKKALETIVKSHPSRFEGLSPIFAYRYIDSPFLAFYFFKKSFLELVDASGLTDSVCSQVKSLFHWVEKTSGTEWDEADALMAQKKISAKHYKLLFRPGELVLLPSKDRHKVVRVYKVNSYPWANNDLGLSTTSWQFNGSFQKLHFNHTLKPDLDVIGSEGDKEITSLDMYPLRFAEPGVYEELVSRGHRFWRCRKSKLVSYVEIGEENGGLKQSEERFMIDYNIFRILHPEKVIFASEDDDLGSKAMAQDQPPEDEFLAMLPPFIHGFDLASKAWKYIRVDRITDVTWNKDAFKRLVVPDSTKELIEAAVTVHGHSLNPSPDIIGGKGHGLLILLHGGPGTGKTLTAEGIAEAQERPLYRVSCGDIGVEPEKVEMYLQTVLLIGKAWGCVVLLDEADVFLEERTMSDQKQNAIVSVFLRMLEYYDGILILTTNRVGTFDEAFKSRIHLALRYPDLGETQRLEIWRNFFDMLKLRDTSGVDGRRESVDVKDLEMNAPKLAQVEINGRQIRNVLTLARYLAQHRGEILRYKHVQDAVASVVKFNEYLLEVRGSDEGWARESRFR